MTFQPTHRAPSGGLPTWDAPDPGRPPGPSLDPGLPVEVVQQQGGWAQIRCSNGWIAWVDGAQLAVHGAGPGTDPDAGPISLPATTAGWTALISGAAIAVLSFLPWLSLSAGGVSFRRTAWKIPAAFLVDLEPDPDGIELGPFLLVLGIAVAVLALVRPASTFALWLGGLSVAVAGMFVVQLVRTDGIGLGEVGVGAWLTAVAGVACLVVPRLGVGARTGASVPATSSTAPAAPAAPSVAAAPEPTVPAAPAVAGWAPTHRVPASGLSCYERPDAATRLDARLDPALQVAVTERRADWAHVMCSNGWATWIDARTLEPLG